METREMEYHVRFFSNRDRSYAGTKKLQVRQHRWDIQQSSRNIPCVLHFDAGHGGKQRVADQDSHKMKDTEQVGIADKQKQLLAKHIRRGPDKNKKTGGDGGGKCDAHRMGRLGSKTGGQDQRAPEENAAYNA